MPKQKCVVATYLDIKSEWSKDTARVFRRHRSGKRHAGRKYFSFHSYVDTMYIYDLPNFCERFLVEKVTFTTYAKWHCICGSGIVGKIHDHIYMLSALSPLPNQVDRKLRKPLDSKALRYVCLLEAVMVILKLRQLRSE
jgi:hypothetical protein